MPEAAQETIEPEEDTTGAPVPSDWAEVVASVKGICSGTDGLEAQRRLRGEWER